MVLANPKRVAVVYMLSHPGGVQGCALALIRGLNEQGIVPDVLWDTPPSRRLLDEAGAQAGFVRLPFRIPHRFIMRLPDSLRYLAWVANVVSGERYRERYDCFYSFYNGFLVPQDVPHVYYLSGPPLLPQLETGPVGMKGVPVRMFRRLYRNLLSRRWPVYEYHRNCKYVINSQYTARLFREAHGVSLPVVYPPIDLTGRGFEPEDLSKRDTLLFFSRIVEYKRPEMVLDLARRHRQYRCVVMGGVTPNRRSYFQTLQQRARKAGLEVIFLPNPTDTTVRQEMACCERALWDDDSRGYCFRGHPVRARFWRAAGNRNRRAPAVSGCRFL
jgi:glycosyltransferase involved in cell wall biosynthesis